MKLLIKGGALLQMTAETPEDRKSIQQLVMYHMEPKSPPLAEVFIKLLPNGLMHLSSQRLGGFDSSYANFSQERVMTIELPKLIAELREPCNPPPLQARA
jgi:hypothetical protein